MKTYGVLPESFDPDRDRIDVYAVERDYWSSLYHQAPIPSPTAPPRPGMHQ